MPKSSIDGCDFLFTGSRDGTLKRWSLAEDVASCSATFESHVDWVFPIYVFLSTIEFSVLSKSYDVDSWCFHDPFGFFLQHFFLDGTFFIPD